MGAMKYVDADEESHRRETIAAVAAAATACHHRETSVAAAAAATACHRREDISIYRVRMRQLRQRLKEKEG